MKMNQKKLALFVDDDNHFLEALEGLLEHQKFEVQTYVAKNGYHVIDEVIKRKPDVLFMDFNLPRANGGQILPVLRSIKSFAKVPVYFVTGHNDQEVKPLLKDMFYNGILKKTDALISEITNVLNQTA